jgi:hypothetical protein
LLSGKTPSAILGSHNATTRVVTLKRLELTSLNDPATVMGVVLVSRQVLGLQQVQLL